MALVLRTAHTFFCAIDLVSVPFCATELAAFGGNSLLHNGQQSPQHAKTGKIWFCANLEISSKPEQTKASSIDRLLAKTIGHILKDF